MTRLHSTTVSAPRPADDASARRWFRSAAAVAILLTASSLLAQEPGPTTESFDRGLLPKIETGAARLLESHSDFDGRGVVVAIFDTGVDPGAAGLQQTTDEHIKVIDLIDGTGSGDVDTSTVRTASGQRITGLTGRTLKIPNDWKNPSGNFHLGWKRAFDLYPGQLVARLKRERRKQWDREQRVMSNTLAAQLAEWDKAHPKPNAAERLEREERLEAITQLKAASGNLKDPGPIFDCVLFHDGDTWRAAIDTDEDGDLGNETVLTTYRDEPKYATFSTASLLNFTVNIFDNGNLLSIVTTAGAHGTHVAGIVAAHYPDQPGRNGLAPGARIVSVKIGDTRLGSMETGAGLVRGLGAVLRNHCDLVNMSYGEPSHLPNRGRLVSLFSELVNRHGVVFVASAGNAGPALSTVGSPGGTSSALLGVGAYVSPAMMRSEYSLRKLLPGMPYTWSSRGPASDGDAGVDIFAPGGAVAPVPNWTLQGSMRMNGTSMSAPNACGNLALLISGLKQQGVSYTPTSLKRAIRNTAVPIQGTAADGFGQGPGLLQVDLAWQHLLDHAQAVGELLEIDVTVSGGRGRRGVYLRDAHETRQAASRLVRLTPRFPEGFNNKERVAFGLNLTLEATEDWIQCGQQLLLTHGGGSFQLVVDPGQLEPGAYFGQVLVHDSEHPERGPLARVPITVIKPHTAQDPSTWQATLNFTPGGLARRFLDTPPGTTWADISLTLRSDARTNSNTPIKPAKRTADTPNQSPGQPTDTVAGPNRRFVLHTLQLRPGRSFSMDQSRTYLTLRPGAEVVHSIPVVPGRMLEVCLAQYWSSLGNSSVDCSVRFHGIVPDQRDVTLVTGQGGTVVNLQNRLVAEELNPKATLTIHRSLLPPASSSIKPLDTSRDQLTDNRVIHRLVLEYQFQQSRSGSLTPRFPELDNQLYDSPFGTQLWMLFDSNKRRVGCDDTFPASLALSAGSYRLKLQLRHTDLALLNRHKSLRLALDRPLPKPITLKVAANRGLKSLGIRTRTSAALAVGQSRSIFLVAPSSSQLPASAAPGDLLMGRVQYGKDNPARHGAGRRPSGFGLSLVVTVQSGKTGKPTKSNGSDAAKPKPKSPAKDLASEQQQFLVDRLARIPFESRRKEFDALAKKLLTQTPALRPVLRTRLERLDHIDHRKQRLPEVVAAANDLIATIDTDKLARTLGQRGGRSADKAVLVDALYRKGRALAYMELPDVLAQHPIADKTAHDKDFDNNFKELARWVDTTEKDYVLLHIRRERRRGRPAMALKWLSKYYPGSPPNYWYVKKRRDLYLELDWSHCHQYEQRWLLIQFPKTHESF